MILNTKFKLPNVNSSAETELVYLIQYSTWGHHSLGFYRNGKIIEFTYGDWVMFALNKRDLVTSITHMAWPTLGALGRKTVEWRLGTPLIQHFTNCHDIVPFMVNAGLSNTLFDRLTTAYEGAIIDQVYHQEDDLYFVPYNVSYALWNNCNHELAKWLVELGGTVKGRVFWNPDFIKGMQPRLPSII